MKRRIIAFLGLMVVLLTVNACSTKDSEKTIALFHEKLDTGAYDYICDNLLDEEALQSTARSGWMNLFESMENEGEITNREQQSGFSLKTNNGRTTTRLNYTFDMGGKTYYERIVTIERDDEEKILFYGFHKNEKKANKMVKEY